MSRIRPKTLLVVSCAAASALIVAVVGLGWGPRAPAMSPESREAARAAGAFWPSRSVTMTATGVVEGVVFDQDGRPAPAVAVRLGDGQTTWSAPDGRFEFDDVSPGRHMVSATAPGLAAPPVDVFVSRRERSVAWLHLRAGTSLTVEVIDRETSAPIPGATGSLVVARYGASLRIEASRAATARGLLTFPSYPPGPVLLHVEAPGYAAAVTLATGDRAGLPSRERVVLERGAPLAGVVVDESGRPVADAAVAWRSCRGAGAMREPVRTGADGSFRLVFGPHDGVCELSVDHDAYESTLHALHDETLPDSVRIVIRAGRLVTGRVVDARGQPVSGAAVGTSVPGIGGGKQTITDDAGEFTLRGLPGPHVEQFLYAELDGARSHPVAVPAEPAEPVTLELVHADLAAGVVVHADGRPAAHASVRFQGPLEVEPEVSDRAGRFWIQGEVLADRDGRFEIRGLAPGRYRVMAVAAIDAGEQAAIPLQAHDVLQAGDTDHRLVLPAPTMLTGRVVTAEGAPVAAFSVRLGGGAPVDFHVRDGSFRYGPLSPLPRGVSLEVRADGFVARSLTLAPSSGAHSDVGEIVLTRGHIVRGRVVGADGVGVAGALVAVRTPAPMTERTDPGGAFSITVRELPVSIQAVEIGVGVSRVHEVRHDGARVELLVPETGRLEVRLEGSNGLEAISLQAVDPAPGAFHLLSIPPVPGETAEFAGDLPPGDYLLQDASGADSSLGTSLGNATVEAGRVTRLVIPAVPVAPTINE